MTKWRIAPGFDRYAVSDRGDVVSSPADGKPTRALKPDIGKLGYHRVTLCQDNRRKRFLVHRLVWAAHRGAIPANTQVNHLSGDKGDNSLANLALATGSENIKHAFAAGLKQPTRGEKNGQAKLTANDAASIRVRAAFGEAHSKIADAFGIRRESVGKIVRGERWALILADQGSEQ